MKGNNVIGQMRCAWKQLCDTCHIEPGRAYPAFTALAEAYRSPGRVYHTLEHIQAVLAWIDTLRNHAIDLPTLQLAAWFHDCVYDPRATDNEEQSATYAQNVLSRLALPTSTIQAVSQMIVCTKTHTTVANQPDCQILLDADLAILGASVQDYETYAQAIRQEYSWLPDTAYNAGRTHVLQAFLQRTRIYGTELMHATLEKSARENIRRELASLDVKL